MRGEGVEMVSESMYVDVVRTEAVLGRSYVRYDNTLARHREGSFNSTKAM